MALAPSWESVAAPEIRTPALSLPIRRTGTIPTYPPGRHRGARRSWMYALLTALVDAGCALLVAECVPRALGARITEVAGIPVIGIGAGPECSGQVLVVYDALGIQLTERYGGRLGRMTLADKAHVYPLVSTYAERFHARRFALRGPHAGRGTREI